MLEAQAGGIAPIALGPVTAAVVAEVPERPEEGFRTGEPERGGQLLEGSGVAIAEQGLQPHLQGQHLGGGLLASLHTGLVVGVDVDQFGVEAYGPLKEGDQGAEGRGIEAPQGDAEALAATLGQGRAGALQKTLQEILGPLSGDRSDVGGVVEGLDEGHKEVVEAIAQLLHISVLVGGSLVAVDSQALVHGLPLAVAVLAEGLHHELLQVAAEHLQTIAIGQHHQVAAALAFAGGIPGGGHQGGGIVPQARATGEGIHGGGTGQKAAQVGSDQGGGQEANGAGDAGAASHPIGKVEAGQPALRGGESVELAAGHRDRHGLTGPVATEGLKAGPGLLHADARFRGAAGFAYHHHQGGAQPLAQGREGAAESLGINIVEDMERQATPFLL